MKKILLIALVVIILLLIAGWVYLLLNGAPDNVADFRENIFGSSELIEVVPPQISDNAFTDVSRGIDVEQLLIKLSERNIAGAILISGETENVVRYMEKGTGHIYDISLSSGNEVRVSQNTIPKVVRAIWSGAGNRVVVTTDSNGKLDEILLATLVKNDSGDTVLEFIELPRDADNIAFDEIGDTLYFTEGGPREGTFAQAYNIKTNEQNGLFNLPFGESIVLWSKNGADHIAYTKPTAQYTGYAYKVTDTTLQKIDEGFGLTIDVVGNGRVDTKKAGRLVSLLFNADRSAASILDFILYPEKCDASDSANIMWCGIGSLITVENYPDDWYQGIVSFADLLWQIDIETGDVVLVADPVSLTDEVIDVTDLSVSENGQQVIFINKRDGSLWLLNPPGFGTKNSFDENTDLVATSTDEEID